jgi:Fur family transcriptional regulator, ferric uptake regulator
MPGPNRWRNRVQGRVQRWTATREAILDLLSDTSRHLSAKDIYASLYNECPRLGLTTVYRTLDLLHRSGLIHKLVLGDGQARYEFKEGKKESHHHHLVCLKCGKITDYTEFEKEELEFVQKTEAFLSKKFRFKITDHNIEFLGYCSSCQRTRENDLTEGKNPIDAETKI